MIVLLLGALVVTKKPNYSTIFVFCFVKMTDLTLYMEFLVTDHFLLTDILYIVRFFNVPVSFVKPPTPFFVYHEFFGTEFLLDFMTLQRVALRNSSQSEKKFFTKYA